jgi:hypothetical protein
MATPPNRRELVLDNGRVFVEAPRLMSDEQLADVFADFIIEVKGRRLKGPNGPFNPYSCRRSIPRNRASPTTPARDNSMSVPYAATLAQDRSWRRSAPVGDQRSHRRYQATSSTPPGGCLARLSGSTAMTPWRLPAALPPFGGFRSGRSATMLMTAPIRHCGRTTWAPIHFAPSTAAWRRVRRG